MVSLREPWRSLVVGVALAAIAVAPTVSAASPALTSQPLPMLFFDQRAFAQAVARTNATAPAPMPGVRAVLVPHHWLAGHLLTTALRDLAATTPPSADGSPPTNPKRPWRRLILIGPDHHDAAHQAVMTSDQPWSTPFAAMTTDGDAIRRLLPMGIVADQPAALAREHSVAGLMPAVAYYLPEVKVVPLAVRGNMNRGEMVALAEALATMLGDEGTVVVLSVDFSHGVSPREAEVRDRASLAALQTLDTARVLGIGKRGMDGWTAVAVVQIALRRVGATRFVLRTRTDGSALQGYDGGPVTSYISGYYSRASE
jgi:MEMO1 family protein